MGAVNGKKTYILVAIGALTAALTYLQQVLTGGFDFGELIKFVNSEAIVLAFAAVRHAISKK